ncbi:MAG: GNAT family N-acetyltransferase [SAR202 cluster bacterium]|nr:GNAT family N-acetyltransferase [SAR202 cluster bacterium]
MKFEAPLKLGLSQELINFWQKMFPGSQDVTIEALLGDELDYNRGVFYIARKGNKLAGTCHVTVPLNIPYLGGFGEVATELEFRREGIATELSRQALEEFKALGGQAMFLGTSEPGPARMYRRLGWHRLAGSNVMANITTGASPEEYMVDYFRRTGKFTVQAGGPPHRVPMIPLILTPHNVQVLDSNVPLYSTPYNLQRSCMGLYPRYNAVTKNGFGAWFAAVTEDHRIVGLSSVRTDKPNSCRVDGFTHYRFAEAWKPLIDAALAWGKENGATTGYAVLSVEDEQKHQMYQSEGFARWEPGEDLEFDNRKVESIKMGKTI